jgi:hypothetical protein
MESKFSEAESPVANALKLEPENAQALQLKEELALPAQQKQIALHSCSGLAVSSIWSS